MISEKQIAQIRHLFHAEHWKVGTIASELGVHPDAVRNAIESERFHNSKPLGVSVVDPYIEFIRHTLDQHPRLRATRIVVAHRLSTVISADRIIVMQEGRVVESGAFENLMSGAGPFSQLAARQRG